MRILVWQWGRFGAGPRVAAGLAAGLGAVPEVDALLSLAAGAELLASADAPRCDLPVPTYAGLPGFLGRAAAAPFAVPALVRRLRALAPDCALCAMPGPLDLKMAAALRRTGIRFAVMVHDADLHPGDGFPLQMLLQRRLMRRADALVTLSDHVAERLRARDAGARLLTATLPPFVFGPPPAAPGAHGGPPRLLCFGRLLPYKGLDLLAAGLGRLAGAPAADLPAFEVRVVGSGPESAALDALRRLPGVRVENRWVPEDEVGALLAWSDALVLTHREASQSGVAAAAVSARRWVVATRVGGLAEQLGGEGRAILCEPEPASIAAALAALLRRLAGATDDAGSHDPARGWDATRLARQLEAALVPSPARG